MTAGHHVVVVGAGYAGLTAARRLARARGTGELRVTVVNADDRFVERIRLHQLAAGQSLPGRPLADMLRGTGADLVVARVTGIDAGAGTVRVAEGGRLRDIGYDTLVYAPGSGPYFGSVPGAAEHAHTLAELTGAEAFRTRALPDLVRARGTVLLVGGGLTGIEAAAELAETRPELRVELVTRDTVGAGLSPRGRRHVRRVLDRLGVRVRERCDVTEVRPDGLVLGDGTVLRAGAVVWNAGYQVPDLARRAGIAVDANGRVLVDGTQRSVSHPDVYAVGDAAKAAGIDGRELRMACGSALVMGGTAGSAVAARRAGRPARPLWFRYLFQCVSLGRRDGVIQFVRADDTPLPVVLRGRAAAWFKEGVARAAIAYTRLAGLTPVRGRGAGRAVPARSATR
ncbi:NAD(P)/FAD-dependent oxidoreductase [Marinactinospora rubrisoli]|uniref:NAD(P)/FAD-dependent oxidoreductase n=1 Tax=Marinactinospora rubrisoli TaxID=2715399 RepID=A0ABW2KNP7_9ACTN